MSTYSTTVLSDSPTAYWRLGELSGTTAADASGNSHAGTYAGGFTLGQVGAIASEADGAVLLDGSTGQVSAATSAAFETTTFCLEAWINPAWAGGGLAYNPCVAAYRDNAATRWSLHVGSGAGDYTHVGVYNGSSYVNVAVSGLAQNQWSHLVAYVSGGSFGVYVNGVFQASATQTLGSATGKPLCLGTANTTAGERYVGVLDEVAVYSTPLSAARVVAHYVAGLVGGTIAPPVGNTNAIRRGA